MFIRKGVLKKCNNFIGEHPCRSVISIKVVSLEKVDLILWDLRIGCNFSLVRLTCSKFILILTSSSWISVACVCCFDRDKLWFLIILFKVLLKMLPWYTFSFDTHFDLVFSLVKPFLLVVMEYGLLKKEETTLSLQLCLITLISRIVQLLLTQVRKFYCFQPGVSHNHLCYLMMGEKSLGTWHQ